MQATDITIGVQFREPIVSWTFLENAWNHANKFSISSFPSKQVMNININITHFVNEILFVFFPICIIFNSVENVLFRLVIEFSNIPF
jgi:hypothetical protein